MKITLEDVETILEKDVQASETGSSSYLYLPLKYAGRKVKVCVMKETKEE